MFGMFGRRERERERERGERERKRGEGKRVRESEWIIVVCYLKQFLVNTE
mgnify:CR=1 FL=1